VQGQLGEPMDQAIAQLLQSFNEDVKVVVGGESEGIVVFDGGY
jgi:hypothetical protein